MATIEIKDIATAQTTPLKLDDIIPFGRAADDKTVRGIAQQLGILPVQIVVKEVTQIVNNSEVYVADDELTLDLEAYTKYLVKIQIAVTQANATPSINYRFRVPSNLGLSEYGSIFVTLSSQTDTYLFRSQFGDFAGFYGSAISALCTDVETNIMIFEGTFGTGATGGAMYGEFAQNTAHASNTEVEKGSFMQVTKIGDLTP